MKRYRNVIITFLAFIVVGTFALFTLNMSFLNPIAQVVKDFDMTDIYYQILQDTDSEEYGTVDDEIITIVDMSELYSRRDLADAIDQIKALQPKTLGVDVVFEGLKEDSVGDMMIRQIAETYPDIIFSYKLLDYQNDSTGYSESVHSFFANDSTLEGFTNMQRNLYGGMKRVLSLGRKYEGVLVPSFITTVVGHFQGRDSLEVEDRDVKINFVPRHFAKLSCDSISRHQELIKDRLVLFGAMKDEYDMHYTPLGKMSGVELQAYSIDTLLGQSEVKSPGWFLTGIISFLLAFLTQVVFSKYKAYATKRKNRLLRFVMSATYIKSILNFLWAVFWVWLAFVIFYKYGISINLGWALSAIAFLALANSIYEECSVAIKNRKNEK